MTKTYVFDANALLGLVEAGPGFGKVEQLLQAALRNQALVLTSVLNWGEVFYLLWQRREEEKARQTIANFVTPSHSDRGCRFPAGAASGRTQGTPQNSLFGLCGGRFGNPASSGSSYLRPRFRKARASLSDLVDRPSINAVNAMLESRRCPNYLLPHAPAKSNSCSST
jgi:hypothetical protein